MRTRYVPGRRHHVFLFRCLGIMLATSSCVLLWVSLPSRINLSPAVACSFSPDIIFLFTRLTGRRLTHWYPCYYLLDRSKLRTRTDHALENGHLQFIWCTSPRRGALSPHSSVTILATSLYCVLSGNDAFNCHCTSRWSPYSHPKNL